jgi:hypothetical protein
MTTLRILEPAPGARPAQTPSIDLGRCVVNPTVPIGPACWSVQANAEGLDHNDRYFLAQACDEVETALSELSYDLPPGVIHGDATVANLIPGRDGPVICDFDSTAVGPREWDLTPVAAGHLRFANRANNHAPLAATYGFDVTRWASRTPAAARTAARHERGARTAQQPRAVQPMAPPAEVVSGRGRASGPPAQPREILPGSGPWATGARTRFPHSVHDPS